MSMHKAATELEFEQEFIQYLTQLGGVKQWEYLPEIKTTEQLWQNFKRILEQNNQDKLSAPLSATEFKQVQRVINSLTTPYEAGQFLYGVNGFSEIEVDLDNGQHVFLRVFDKDNVGAGDSVYQVVNQVHRKHIVDGAPDRRFDVTLLVNGLPLIQIELKAATHSTNESLNQMKQYISERQYSNIFSTLQVLVAMTKHDIRYMANTVLAQFNKAFAFTWQRENNAEPVHDWREFTDSVLSIPMAHELATRFMILDGTKNRESIKVMRPYQVYATKRALAAARSHDFNGATGKLGYIWHTTGSGKTITSFKTAWLASRLPNVGKVVFLVDRVALTNQTVDAYRAYDPVTGFEGKSGVIADTANVGDLRKKLLTRSDSNIIVTSIQKMSRYVKRSDFKAPKENILFIVDEAHRSTTATADSSGMLALIRKAIPRSAWLGYTGTPRFEHGESNTSVVFGDLLHAYTIKEAIADKNVLGFHVEFKDTLGNEVPADPTSEDIDDNLKASVYDYHRGHLTEVAADIFNNWQSRSNQRRYNAMFTVHVGGNKPSTPRAMEYFDEFCRLNGQYPEKSLKVAVSFSADTSNGDNMLANNSNLLKAITHYNKTFGTAFDISSVKEYTEDVASRLNRTHSDGNYLDLVIVVDQFLTGFDAPQLNTLYVDRTLKGANLIQAYSRTNRMHDLVLKPWGNVINYRWPVQNEAEMNKAFYLYSNRESAADTLLETETENQKRKQANIKGGILAKSYDELHSELKTVIAQMRKLSNNFSSVPHSEQAREELIGKISEYNSLLNKVSQMTSDEFGEDVKNATDNLDSFYKELNITGSEIEKIQGLLLPRLRELTAKQKHVDLSTVDVNLHHVSEVNINYDYLSALLAKMADAVNEKRMSDATELRDRAYIEIAKSSSEVEQQQWRQFADDIYDGSYKFDTYPAPTTSDDMRKALQQSRSNKHLQLAHAFIGDWGLHQVSKTSDLLSLFSMHRPGQTDLDKQNEVSDLIKNIGTKYQQDAALDEVRAMNKIKYHREFTNALYALADEIKKDG